MNFQGKWALVTGASSGIGEQFARQLAKQGSHLVLAARSLNKLESLASELKTKYAIQAKVVSIDLSQEGAPSELYHQCKRLGVDIELLINNAGFATHGFFEQVSGERQHEEVMLNVAAVVDLTHLFLPDMLRRSSGTVINVASTGGFQPLPYMAVYGATKAFVLSFTKALWWENRDRGIRFFALCPGATDTSFFNVVGTEDASVGKKDTPERVVEAALRALMKGKFYVVPGVQNYIGAQLSRFLTRKQGLRLVGGMLRPSGGSGTNPYKNIGDQSDLAERTIR
ncbi:SDR family oxidoreductase [Paenibacillus sp. YPG26]|uniref:SDR family NAD(P)-dependent oxidoreductase n=1 Tax=Paenibacillus sp. YPG26 TaxID=2878915 RepID=UPI00203D5A98|nr:SDR family oxidoreductase [Paenibacillus sp. YPG26]USB33121.1 SDR family oxidoreductase [Paenibacillus sp. YPG26]